MPPPFPHVQAQHRPYAVEYASSRPPHLCVRLTLRIAGRIATAYYAAGKFDMAVRFFERIAKTYRRERWGTMLRPLLTTWYKCAQRLGDVELSVRILVDASAWYAPISLFVQIIVADEVGKVQVQMTMKTIWHYRRIFLPCSRYGLSLSIMFSHKHHRPSIPQPLITTELGVSSSWT
jgi:hypothetical protein